MVEDRGFLEILRDLICDSNPTVVANAVAALSEIQESSGRDVMQITGSVLQKLLAALNECTEWGQVFQRDACGLTITGNNGKPVPLCLSSRWHFFCIMPRGVYAGHERFLPYRPHTFTETACPLSLGWPACLLSQVFILDSLSKYRPSDSAEAEGIIERVTPRLQHANSAVVMSAVKVRPPPTHTMGSDSSKAP